MLIEKRVSLQYKHIAENVGLARKKNSEALPNFCKEDIELVFVDVDEQLKQLAYSDNTSKVRRIITIQQIRNRLFELCNLAVHGMDVRAFASHEPGDKTSLSGGC